RRSSFSSGPRSVASRISRARYPRTRTRVTPFGRPLRLLSSARRDRHREVRRRAVARAAEAVVLLLAGVGDRLLRVLLDALHRLVLDVTPARDPARHALVARVELALGGALRIVPERAVLVLLERLVVRLGLLERAAIRG